MSFNGSRKDKRKRKREKGNGDPTEDRIKIHKTGRRERQRERERERERERPDPLMELGTMAYPPTSIVHGSSACNLDVPPAACEPGKTSIRDFDPEQLGSENLYTTEVPADIAAYVEKFFRKPLTSEQFRAMGKHSPRPKTDAMVVPTVDPAVQSWVGPRFPHTTDKMLSACQLELLTSAGPLTSLWNDCVKASL